MIILQANETKHRAIEMKRKESEERLAELANTCFSDLLLETSSLDMPDRWKGMTKEELNRIRHEQLEQIDEKQVHRFSTKKHLNACLSLTIELFFSGGN